MSSPAETAKGMNQVLAVMLSSAIPPLVGLGAGLIQRMGRAGRMRELEYLTKRAQLVETLLGIYEKHPNQAEQSAAQDALHTELKEVLTVLRAKPAGKPAEEAAASHDEFEQRSRLRRFLTVPKPVGIGPWILTIVYYVYGFYFVILPFVTPFALVSNGEHPSVATWSGVALGWAANGALVYGARTWALSIAKKRRRLAERASTSDTGFGRLEAGVASPQR